MNNYHKIKQSRKSLIITSFGRIKPIIKGGKGAGGKEDGRTYNRWKVGTRTLTPISTTEWVIIRFVWARDRNSLNTNSSLVSVCNSLLPYLFTLKYNTTEDTFSKSYETPWSPLRLSLTPQSFRKDTDTVNSTQTFLLVGFPGTSNTYQSHSRVDLECY